MKSFLTAALVAAGVLAFGLAPARAQVTNQTPPPVGPRPPISPYLNLRGPGGPGFEYFLRTRPMEETRTSLQQLQQQQVLLGQAVTQTTDQAGLLTTGHVATFGNYSHYYGGGRQGTMNAPAATSRPAVTPQNVLGGGRGGR